jgi:16S rRNA (cytidine1402-2'-O)-methyltransferase
VVVTALAVSGLDTGQFRYLGFLPNRASARRKLLQSIADEPATMVAFEAPHRLKAALADILDIVGDRQIAVCRELTKLHEEVFRGRVQQAIEHFTEPRGEFTLVIAGRKEAAKPPLTGDIEKRLRSMKRSGVGAKEAVAQVAAETGISKKELYRAWLKSG